MLMGDRYAKVRDNVATSILAFYNISFPAATSPDCDVCPAQSVGLVHYPAAPAPSSGSQTVTTQCADNASPTTGLSVTCRSDGSWSGNPQCQCNSGYQMATIDGRQVCLG